MKSFQSSKVILCRTFSTTNKILQRRRPGSSAKREKEFDLEMLNEYRFDGMTKPGYDILLAQSEIRKYLRKAEYELPQLTKFAEAFKPPSSDKILCFKTMYYIGEDHPLQNKVVMTVKEKDLPLTKEQLHKFKVLCGPRFNGKGKFKFSCEKFPHQAQNKKYLSDLMDRLLDESRNDTETFADIPVDLRHVKTKKRHPFPREWLLQPKDNLKLKNQVSTNLITDTVVSDDDSSIKQETSIYETITVKSQ
ncbi:mitochondrial ribosomal subunit protein-domain-containing protein [Gigaspora margarita]|uniref:Mitochondrial ribosomal subunit protein-domain-containing protein n=1 Tax=Gigaspora margarita TaxID=4874 RepID=A0A8H4EVB3_GIGMA|nr:mitochondrial ribosomal subunit protein-domain-containing protein [Gigaspora margarita]